VSVSKRQFLFLKHGKNKTANNNNNNKQQKRRGKRKEKEELEEVTTAKLWGQAHLVAQDFYSVVANMRGASAEEVAERVLACPGLEGLQGPTIAPVYTKHGDEAVAQHGYYATTICVRKKQLYRAVKELRAVRYRLSRPFLGVVDSFCCCCCCGSEFFFFFFFVFSSSPTPPPPPPTPPPFSPYVVLDLILLLLFSSLVFECFVWSPVGRHMWHIHLSRKDLRLGRAESLQMGSWGGRLDAFVNCRLDIRQWGCEEGKSPCMELKTFLLS
jgi:HisG, C-terminal domain